MCYKAILLNQTLANFIWSTCLPIYFTQEERFSTYKRTHVTVCPSSLDPFWIVAYYKKISQDILDIPYIMVFLNQEPEVCSILLTYRTIGIAIKHSKKSVITQWVYVPGAGEPGLRVRVRAQRHRVPSHTRRQSQGRLLIMFNTYICSCDL